MGPPVAGAPPGVFIDGPAVAPARGSAAAVEFPAGAVPGMAAGCVGAEGTPEPAPPSESSRDVVTSGVSDPHPASRMTSETLPLKRDHRATLCIGNLRAAEETQSITMSTVSKLEQTNWNRHCIQAQVTQLSSSRSYDSTPLTEKMDMPSAAGLYRSHSYF